MINGIKSEKMARSFEVSGSWKTLYLKKRWELYQFNIKDNITGVYLYSWRQKDDKEEN